MSRIQLRRDTAARWAEYNPVLLEGEVGYEIDTNLRKIGDGVHSWKELDYLRAEGIVQETGDSENGVMSQKAVTRELTELGEAVALSVKNKGGHNVIQPNSFSIVGYIDDQGVIKDYSDWVTCPLYLCVQPNQVYNIGSDNVAIAFYDANHNIVGHLLHVENTETTYTTASNVCYARFSTYHYNIESENLYFSTNKKGKFEEYPKVLTCDGLQLSPKSIGGQHELNTHIKNSLSEQQELNALLKNSLSDPVVRLVGYNFLAAEFLTEMGYIGEDGEINTHFTDWVSCKVYQQCKPNTTYHYGNEIFGVAFYNVERKVISQTLFLDEIAGEIVSPPNACYVRVSTYPYLIGNSGTYFSDRLDFDNYPILENNIGLPISARSIAGTKRKIATLGTSITCRGHYQKIIGHHTGAIFFNNGLSGRSMAYFAFHRKENTESEFDRLLQSADFEDVDAIIICGYANDLWGKIGSLGDNYATISQGEASKYSSLADYAQHIGNFGYIPAARSVIEYICSICPNIPILVAGELPMSRPQEGWNGSTTSVDFHRVYNGSNATCQDFSDALKSVAEYYGLPYVDMNKNGQINGLNYTIYYDGSDTTHPNFKDYDTVKGDYPNSGMKRMAILMMNGLREVLPNLFCK